MAGGRGACGPTSCPLTAAWALATAAASLRRLLLSHKQEAPLLSLEISSPSWELPSFLGRSLQLSAFAQGSDLPLQDRAWSSPRTVPPFPLRLSGAHEQQSDYPLPTPRSPRHTVVTDAGLQGRPSGFPSGARRGAVLLPLGHSWEQHGWSWTARRGPGGSLWAGALQGQRAALSGPWQATRRLWACAATVACVTTGKKHLGSPAADLLPKWEINHFACIVCSCSKRNPLWQQWWLPCRWPEKCTEPPWYLSWPRPSLKPPQC